MSAYLLVTCFCSLDWSRWLPVTDPRDNRYFLVSFSKGKDDPDSKRRRWFSLTHPSSVSVGSGTSKKEVNLRGPRSGLLRDGRVRRSPPWPLSDLSSLMWITVFIVVFWDFWFKSSIGIESFRPVINFRFESPYWWKIFSSEFNTGIRGIYYRFYRSYFDF